jgi:hypothetical protein
MDCIFSQPVAVSNTGALVTAGVNNGNFAFQKMNCTGIASSTNFIIGTSTPLTRDGGTMSFLLLIIIFTLFLMVVGFLYNNMTAKKPWR